MDDKYYLMWLLSVDGINTQKARRLLEIFGNAENIWRCGEAELRKLPSVAPSLINNILSARNEDILYGLIERLTDGGYGFVSINCPEYPPLLKEIFDPPLALFTDGRLPDWDNSAVSVIGSRKCTEYGLSAAEKLSEGLARRGVTVVSGMARGIDAMAHRGALNAGGQTVAVLGCGVDVCYPPEHFALKDDIAKNGCVVSEYPLGTQPEKYFFPERNRIISGLSMAVVVVEAERRSGTSITVDMALAQGREVMAVPGGIFSKYSAGTNHLISLGAPPVTCAEDVLIQIGKSETLMEKITEVEKRKPPLVSEENLVYACISLEPVLVEELLQTADLSLQDLQYTLVSLEIKGYIHRLPGQRYIRA